MKPDYKNWMPKGMIIGMSIGTAVLFILWLLALLIPGAKNGIRIFIIVVLAIAFLATANATYIILIFLMS